ncbi:thiamine ABC transporter substrate binding subunit [Nocardioides sp. Kera G14]|uniref:thiamine ABC transporter substrate-binding protein n=1 Tax=Nocardioides sp. Kera G14 TaxID=2884264 RepID=UPI001D123F4F|nr:thiamine ABC transporter substrate-binding protein [Nocardioides sp. Kera G14]UDY23834.1 thiamine ABC transporter substrate-binding protein [Nocardioides sp. Kera G14]
MFLRAISAAAAALSLIPALAACGSSDSTSTGDKPTTVTVVTHDSFALPKELQAEFEKESGYTLKVLSNGDAGQLTNKLVLTKDAPLGDVAFGVDNTFGSRALKNGVFADYTPADLPDGLSQFDLPDDSGSKLTPIDTGNVCLNIDTDWFAAHKVAPPVTLDDLTKPAYKDLTVLPGAATSSPGLAFLLTTIAAKGDDWPAYWKALMANGAEITQGWSDAYEVDFTAGGGNGKRPIVLSYDSSPAFTVKDGKTSTQALLGTCFTQIEYAGVLAHAKNPAGAQAFVDFLLSPEVQKALPDAMYVFPVVPNTPLPADWAKFAKRPTKPWTLFPSDIDKNRDTWLQQWSDVTSQ